MLCATRWTEKSFNAQRCHLYNKSVRLWFFFALAAALVRSKNGNRTRNRGTSYTVFGGNVFIWNVVIDTAVRHQSKSNGTHTTHIHRKRECGSTKRTKCALPLSLGSVDSISRMIFLFALVYVLSIFPFASSAFSMSNCQTIFSLMFIWWHSSKYRSILTFSLLLPSPLMVVFHIVSRNRWHWCLNAAAAVASDTRRLCVFSGCAIKAASSSKVHRVGKQHFELTPTSYNKIKFIRNRMCVLASPHGSVHGCHSIVFGKNRTWIWIWNVTVGAHWAL